MDFFHGLPMLDAMLPAFPWGDISRSAGLAAAVLVYGGGSGRTHGQLAVPETRPTFGGTPTDRYDHSPLRMGHNCAGPPSAGYRMDLCILAVPVIH